jgi:Flp pilus assembly protein TadG
MIRHVQEMRKVKMIMAPVLKTLRNSARLLRLALSNAGCGKPSILPRSFWKDCRGGVAPIAALAAIPLLGMTGAAVDYSLAHSARTAMQAALDSTALAVAKQDASGAQVPGQAQQFFYAIFVRPEVQNLAFTANESSVNGGMSANLSASGSIKTSFLGVVGISTINIGAHSLAFAKSDGLGCVLSLNSSATGAVSVGGSTTVALNNCSLYDNSSDASALTIGGSASLSALSVDVVGKVSYSGSNITTTEGISTGQAPVSDPYGDVAIPSLSGCTQNKFTVKSAITIDPGVYCDGLSVNAGATLTLNPGIYYLDRGSFSVNGGATITGQGVTLVFTSSTGSNWATASINGSATVNLTAPIAGPTAGIVIFGDRQIPTGTAFKFNGGASQYLGGAIYVPTGAINYSGGMGTSTSCTQIIGDTVNFSGNSNVAINCSNYKVRPFSSRVVRLVS